jgi:adenylylsulfate kinase-like enzyme
MIHPFQEDRDLFKDKLSNYFQAYLKCDIEKCAKRDEKISKGVYALRQIKERPQVVGHDIPFHEPSSVDITLDSDNKEASVLLEEIWEEFWNRFTQNK